jgi:hypothetical protein
MVVGELLWFGTWDNRPILWQVLATDGGKALIHTVGSVAWRAFDSREVNNWGFSEIRLWLNRQFADAAFTDAEKAAIAVRELRDVPKQDRVFLLSKEEANLYFASDDDRVCEEDSPKPSWWLRAPGEEPGHVAYVNYGGEMTDEMNTDEADIGVRPALWLRIDAYRSLRPDATEEAMEETSVEHDIKIDSEYFGVVINGRKTFEIRKDDRDYKVADVVRMREVNAQGILTGRSAIVQITYITDYAQREGYVVWAFELICIRTTVVDSVECRESDK